ncbi:MAG: hypothetical protein KF826_03255 [Xanthobacteraceae bacterium]|nr:hypothetical protein [Xanthobacteraceae bacterium]MBX3533344.1 hypothetical protein [Xanthobacteraceae bacterium]MCW5676028.1 hypothetical protein [Xanthobacteraceae bacterium]MCW5679323.1 hypothetical protein [Xanthobacteraceae bacterium]
MPVRFRWFDAVLLSAAAFFSFAIAAMPMLTPKDQSANGLAVIFAPWTAAPEALAFATEAGARFVRFGAFDFIAIVEPQSEHYASQALERGAWFVADPVALAACLKPFASK